MWLGCRSSPIVQGRPTTWSGLLRYGVPAATPAAMSSTRCWCSASWPISPLGNRRDSRRYISTLYIQSTFNQVLSFLIEGDRRYSFQTALDRPGGTNAVMMSLAAIIVIAMGPARMIVKDHWPADVAGGYLISLPLLMGVIWAHAHLPSWLGRSAPRVSSVLTGEPPG